MQNRLLTIPACALLLLNASLVAHPSQSKEPDESEDRSASPPVADNASVSGLDLIEMRQCRQNLHLIFEAIQAYRRVHQDIPMQLGELLPVYLSEQRHVICPTARRLGLTSLDLAKRNGGSLSTYTYEFEPEPIPKIISGGSPRSMREWKRLQMGLIGSEVPMVRCLTHERAALNLSFGGRIYESGNLDWEPLFEDVVDARELWFAPRFAAYTVVKRIVVPKRDPASVPTMIDLSDHYNCVLDEIWPGLEPLRPLAELRPGIHEFNGVNFDVRGAVQLNATLPGLVHYPAAVSNIIIRLPGRGAHLLLGAVHDVSLGTPVADCVFHLAGGRQQRFRIIYGSHLLACCPPTGGEIAPLPLAAHLAWRGQIENRQIVRLYQCEWTNPSPEQVIDRMDFVVQPANGGPYLVALTMKPVLGPPLTEALPSGAATPH